jgi:hypothetical protein
MEKWTKAYSMLSRRPWLKQKKAHHDWGNNTITITLKHRTMMHSIIKHVNIITIAKEVGWCI